MAGNPVLGFLNVQPTGTGPHAVVTKMLRLLGIIVLVGAAVSVINTILIMAMGTAYYGGAAAAGGAIFGLIFGLAVAAAVCFWITFTITAWNNHDAKGNTHVLVIGILAAVFGVLGVIFGLTGAAFGAAIFAAGVSPLYMVFGVLQLLVSAAYAYCGIMILMNRNKATGAGHSGTTT